MSFPNNTRGGVPNSSGYYVDANGATSGIFTFTASATGFTSSAVTRDRPGRAWRGRRRAAPAFVLTPDHS